MNVHGYVEVCVLFECTGDKLDILSRLLSCELSEETVVLSSPLMSLHQFTLSLCILTTFNLHTIGAMAFTHVLPIRGPQGGPTGQRMSVSSATFSDLCSLFVTCCECCDI